MKIKLLGVLRLIKNNVLLVYRFIVYNPRKWLTVKIVVFSAYFRFKVKYLSSEKLERYMGEKDKESPDEDTLENMRHAYRIGYRVSRVCDNTVWESKCLIKALTTQRFLYKMGIKSTLYLGVGKENDKMVAHAWLRCGKVYATGGNGEGYTMVAKFCK